MSQVVVIGGGVAGLGTALALGGQGHQVTVVERDDVSLPDTPDAAFSSWPRRGAPQTRHSHAFLARLRNLLRDREPRLLADLLAAGATEMPFTDNLPPEMVDRDPRPGDEDLVAIACRRTTFEWVLRRDAVHSRGVQLRQGTVTGLCTGAPRADGVSHITGVALEDGSVLAGDLIVDASGRRSPLPAWLQAIGAPPIEEREEDTGIVYSSRFYRLRAGADEPKVDGPVGGDLGYLKYAVFLGDNRTFSVTFGIPSDDADMRALLKPAPFTAAADALPVARAWLEVAEPITGVEVMARLLNRRRRFVHDGRPVVTGLVAVGDSNICTNPLYGRGCSLGFVQAYLLADVMAATGEPAELALAFDEAIRREVEPWYRAAVAQDRGERRARQPDATFPEPDDDAFEGPPGLDPASARSLLQDGLMPATRTDPVVYRAFLRMFNLLTPPDELMQDPDVLARVLTVWQDRDNRPAPPPLGPGRDEMLRLLAAA